jgi:hypothetical protein
MVSCFGIDSFGFFAWGDDTAGKEEVIPCEQRTDIFRKQTAI